MKKGICGQPRLKEDHPETPADAETKPQTQEEPSHHLMSLGSIRMGARRASGFTGAVATHVFHPGVQSDKSAMFDSPLT